jgi:hypothetical protein
MAPSTRPFSVPRVTTRRRRICFCKAIYRLATSIRAVISWAELLQRVFLEDALACPCGGGRRVIA